MMTVNLLILVRGYSSHTINSFQSTQHFVVWVYTFVSVFVPFSMDEYGQMPNPIDGCWIPGSHNYYRWLFYMPLLITCTMTFGLLFILPMLNLTEGPAPVARRRLFLRLVLMLAAFLLLWSWAAVDRIIDWFAPGKLGDAWGWLHITSLTASGIVNFLVWRLASLCFSRRIRGWQCCATFYHEFMSHSDESSEDTSDSMPTITPDLPPPVRHQRQPRSILKGGEQYKQQQNTNENIPNPDRPVRTSRSVEFHAEIASPNPRIQSKYLSPPPPGGQTENEQKFIPHDNEKNY